MSDNSIVTSEVVRRRFESPDELRTFEKGRLEIVRLGGLTLGRATYAKAD